VDESTSPTWCAATLSLIETTSERRRGDVFVPPSQSRLSRTRPSRPGVERHKRYTPASLLSPCDGLRWTLRIVILTLAITAPLESMNGSGDEAFVICARRELRELPRIVRIRHVGFIGSPSLGNAAALAV